ncbi:MAG: signal peptide peptidase SppA, partial [Muribaculaceae bacterium]|nr:signal peptide peptidase SppA [Muribaculaceae bacterium]
MGKAQSIPDKAILHLHLSGIMQERPGNEEIDMLTLATGGSLEYMNLDETLKALEVAKDDDNIKGLYIECDGIEAPAATLHQVRNAVADFKKSGKFVYAYG